MMGIYAFLAEALRYPAPGRLEKLTGELHLLPTPSYQKSLGKFLESLRKLSPGEWEELYTHTFDLNPAVAPYVGFQTWGENYPRGDFMSLVNRQLQLYEVDLDGELPDHLVPLLRYLNLAEPPLPQVVEVFAPAVQRMIAVLKKSQPGNPYLDLLAVVSAAANELPARV
jgi:nitrate reductase molybdenum cofactor assembly chaperone NarJ/NarW